MGVEEVYVHKTSVIIDEVIINMVHEVVPDTLLG